MLTRGRKDRRRSIAVVHIQVNHHCSFNGAILQQPRQRDRHIVQDAEAFAMVRVRMMKSSADRTRRAIAQGKLRRLQRSAAAQQRCIHQRL